MATELIRDEPAAWRGLRLSPTPSCVRSGRAHFGGAPTALHVQFIARLDRAPGAALHQVCMPAVAAAHVRGCAVSAASPICRGSLATVAASAPLRRGLACPGRLVHPAYCAGSPVAGVPGPRLGRSKRPGQVSTRPRTAAGSSRMSWVAHARYLLRSPSSVPPLGSPRFNPGPRRSHVAGHHHPLRCPSPFRRRRWQWHRGPSPPRR